MSGTARLPYGTLALGAEGIKEAISGFDDAYVMTDVPHVLSLTTLLPSQSQVGYRERGHARAPGQEEAAEEAAQDVRRRGARRRR